MRGRDKGGQMGRERGRVFGQERLNGETLAIIEPATPEIPRQITVGRVKDLWCLRGAPLRLRRDDVDVIGDAHGIDGVEVVLGLALAVDSARASGQVSQDHLRPRVSMGLLQTGRHQRRLWHNQRYQAERKKGTKKAGGGEELGNAEVEKDSTAPGCVP